MSFNFAGALSPYLGLPIPISKSLPLFTSYFSPFTQYSSIFPQILLYHFTQMETICQSVKLPCSSLTGLPPSSKLKKSAIAPFSLLLLYSGAPIKYPVVRPLVLKKFFISLLLSDSILSISEFSGNAQTLQSIRRLIITRILSKALSSNSL